MGVYYIINQLDGELFGIPARAPGRVVDPSPEVLDQLMEAANSGHILLTTTNIYERGIDINALTNPLGKPISTDENAPPVVNTPPPVINAVVDTSPSDVSSKTETDQAANSESEIVSDSQTVEADETPATETVENPVSEDSTTVETPVIPVPAPVSEQKKAAAPTGKRKV